MAETVRKYVELAPRLAEELKRQADILGLSESELIRRCLEQGKTIYQVQLTDEEEHRLRKEELRFIEERARQFSVLNKQTAKDAMSQEGISEVVNEQASAPLGAHSSAGVRETPLSDEEQDRLFEEALDLMHERARRSSGLNRPRTWTREELYDDYKVDELDNPVSD